VTASDGNEGANFVIPASEHNPAISPNNSPRNMEGHADYDTENFSEGLLECTVDKPQKELDGTKDAYISYLVFTRVILTKSPATSEETTEYLPIDSLTSNLFSDPSSL
jgi:hypothetical protein